MSTIAAAQIKPSKNWLGNYSTKEKIKKSGLWQVNELYNECLTEKEFRELKKKCFKAITMENEKFKIRFSWTKVWVEGVPIFLKDSMNTIKEMASDSYPDTKLWENAISYLFCYYFLYFLVSPHYYFYF